MQIAVFTTWRDEMFGVYLHAVSKQFRASAAVEGDRHPPSSSSGNVFPPPTPDVLPASCDHCYMTLTLASSSLCSGRDFNLYILSVVLSLSGSHLEEDFFMLFLKIVKIVND